MSKSVLILDTPGTCVDCQFCCEFHEGTKACCSITDDDKDKTLMKEIDCEDGYCQGKPNWCPLKPLPEKDDFVNVPHDEYYTGYHDDWDNCLDEITGGKNK
jgi:hypothetical protein|nr:MAG TPA: hypothetical protein [Caudoviricetes sp.]